MEPQTLNDTIEIFHKANGKILHHDGTKQKLNIMNQKQKIKTTKLGTVMVNLMNAGKKYDEYTGTIVCRSGVSDFLVEIDQPGVKTFNTANCFVEEEKHTDKAFIYISEVNFERI